MLRLKKSYRERFLHSSDDVWSLAREQIIACEVLAELTAQTEVSAKKDPWIGDAQEPSKVEVPAGSDVAENAAPAETQMLSAEVSPETPLTDAAIGVPGPLSTHTATGDEENAKSEIVSTDATLPVVKSVKKKDKTHLLPFEGDMAEGEWNKIPFTADELASVIGCRPEAKAIQEHLLNKNYNRMTREKHFVCYTNLHSGWSKKLKEIESQKNLDRVS